MQDFLLKKHFKPKKSIDQAREPLPTQIIPESMQRPRSNSDWSKLIFSYSLFEGAIDSYFLLRLVQFLHFFYA